MKFYRVVVSPNAKSNWFLDAPKTPDGEEVDPRNFCECVRWEGTENLLVPSATGAPGRFILGEFDYPVLDASVATAVAKLDPSVQFIPLSIAGRRGHGILNVLRSVECIDEDGSEFDRFQATGSRPDLAGEYSTFYRMRLDPTKIPKCAHIFRIAGYEIAMIVSELMKHVLVREKGDDGIVFMPVT